MPVRAALYARISLDELGQSKGVARQIEDARALAEARGWEVTAEFIDNSISALNGSHRPAYTALMDGVEAGLFDRIVVYMTSRLWRNRSERASAIDKLGRLNVGIAAVKGPDLDLTTAAGRMVAGILGEMDTAESEVKGERVARAVLQRAQEGKAHGPVAFGWRRVYDTDATGRIVGSHDVEQPEQAAIVREVVDRLLAGDSLGTLVNDFNRRQLPTPGRASKWKHQLVTQLARRPANAGLRVHKGEIIGNGAWTPLVERDVHDRVTALLSAPERRLTKDGKRKYLLSFGIGACGVCGSNLQVKTIRGKRGKPYQTYRCHERNCLSRVCQPVDELAEAVVIARLNRPDAAGIFDGDDGAATEARDRVQAIRARLDLAADQFADGAIDGAQLARITAKLRPEMEAAESEARRNRRVPLPREVTDLQGDTAGQVWSSLSVTVKRAVMQVLGIRVVIHPRRKSGPGFEPETVEFRWG